MKINRGRGLYAPQTCKGDNVENLPDRMTGDDLIVQEQYESEIEKQMYDSADSVTRRDRMDTIVSHGFSEQGKRNYGNINWGLK